MATSPTSPAPVLPTLRPRAGTWVLVYQPPFPYSCTGRSGVVIRVGFGDPKFCLALHIVHSVLDPGGVCVFRTVKLGHATGRLVPSEQRPSSTDSTTTVFRFLFFYSQVQSLPFFLVVCGYFSTGSALTKYPADSAHGTNVCMCSPPLPLKGPHFNFCNAYF